MLSIPLTPFLIGCIGVCIGSFLNVCIYRIPRELPILFSRSYCPHCKSQIPLYWNIPIISFLMLGGRCRNCKFYISTRYPLVELLMGGMTWVLYHRFGLTPIAVIYTYFIATLMIVSFIDIDFRIIPDLLSIPGIVIGIALSLIENHLTPADAISGAAIGFLGLWGTAALFTAVTGREGLGGGDIKLIAMVGAFLGSVGVVQTIFLSSLLGTIYGGITILLRRNAFRTHFAFGPFIAIAALMTMGGVSDYLFTLFERIIP